MGFTWTIAVTGNAVVSYTAFPPLPVKQAVYFCCTILGVTSTRRYLASCPAKPGLSSPAAFRQLQPRLSALLNIFNFNYSDFFVPSNTILNTSIRNSSSGPIPTKRLPYIISPFSSGCCLTISITTSRISWFGI